MPPRRNVEIKARITSLAEAAANARRLGAEEAGVLRQVDTYFRCRRGRLKLREITDDHAELIWYARPDQAASKLSQYRLVPVENPDDLLAALSESNGVETVVRKRRTLWMLDNVRIHLDEVAGLGDFLEFEAVLSPTDSPDSGTETLNRLLREFGIQDEDLLTGSYRELMLASGPASEAS